MFRRHCGGESCYGGDEFRDLLPGLIAELSGAPGAHPFRNTNGGLAEMAAAVTMRVMNLVRENYCLGSAGKRQVGIANPSHVCYCFSLLIKQETF